MLDFTRMLIPLLILTCAFTSGNAYRTWECKENKCTKTTTDAISSAISVQECKLLCLPYNGLWPAPTGSVAVGTKLITVSTKDIAFVAAKKLPSATDAVLGEAEKVFLSRLKGTSEDTDDTYQVQVSVDISAPDVTYYTSGADESYSLSSTVNDQTKKVQVTISAGTFLGARHALETLAQLIVYDDIHKRFRTPNSFSLDDKPSYQFRGVGLDTSRSYFSVPAILNVIDGLAQNKMNSFRWHITDSHSFPYVSPSYPQMAREGAYSDSKVYTQDDMKLVVEYAHARGVRVTPELDAPAHVGEGWDALGDNLITCFRWQPWTQYCVEPPCGQFDPTQDRLYDILSTIYQEYSTIFKSDLFHMGGDEVNFNCWQSTERIVQWMQKNNYTVDHDGFIRLWDLYQTRALQALQQSQPSATPVLWTSSLTEVQGVLDPSKYLIQIWTKRNDAAIGQLLQQNFKVIFSNYDELYMDCGGAAWIGNGQNWCSPYVGWQNVYQHSPRQIVKNLNINVSGVEDLIIGSEAALWTEQNDEQLSEGRLFPRAAALAERLWSDPSGSWEDAQYRMNNHRDRLVKNGLRAELLQPEWCYHNDGFCGTS